MDRSLAGGKVQKLLFGRVGAREITLLQVRVPSETVYVLVASGYGAGVVDGSQRDRLRARLVANGSVTGVANAGANAPNVAGSARQQSVWRHRFVGASLLSLDANEATFERDGGLLRAAARADPFLTWTRAEKRASEPVSNDSQPAASRGGAERVSDEPRDPPRGEPREGLREKLRVRGGEIAEALLEADVGTRRDTFRRALSKALARIDRRIEAVQQDQAKMEEAKEAARRAQLFVVEAARAPRGATELQAIDWSSGVAVPTRWPLDPAKTAQSQIDAAFHRARRMKSAAGMVADRLRAAVAARDTLSTLASALERPVEDLAPEDWSKLESRARTAAPLDFKLPSGTPLAADTSPPRTARTKPAAGGRARPYRTFVGRSKMPIFVGKSAEHNDALTLRVARPHDLWLHAKGWTGAHVIVPLGKTATCPPDTLVEAAHLAAHFSDARGETVVEVAYTPRRYVRKPRGSAPGAVVLEREKIIVLRSRPDTLRELLAGET